jgi:hypothetical protein
MRFSLHLTGDKMNDEIEVRYVEYVEDWQLTMYDNDTNSHNDGMLGTQPVWLQLILDVAKVGGHLQPLREGPPDVILWFKIDKDFNLLEITFP